MTSGNDEIEYKKLFRKMEEETNIPDFENILNSPARQKKYSGKLMPVGSILLFGLLLAFVIYYFLSTPTGVLASKNATAQVWEWKSPTQYLLSTALSNTYTDFTLPTDYLFPLKTSSQINNQIKN